jgi:Rrf2 family protein
MVSINMITRKTDYAIRCVLHLAESEKDVVMINEIAEQRQIPRSFLAKILQTLAHAGIVVSMRGVKGGFKLAKRPGDISLLDIVQVMEGPVAMNVCGADKKKCSLSSTCTVHPVWVDIRRDIEHRLREWDFARLAETTNENVQ